MEAAVGKAGDMCLSVSQVNNRTPELDMCPLQSRRGLRVHHQLVAERVDLGVVVTVGGVVLAKVIRIGFLVFPYGST